MKVLTEIAYARASLRNMREKDTLGDPALVELDMAISLLNQAQGRVAKYRDLKERASRKPAE